MSTLPEARTLLARAYELFLQRQAAAGSSYRQLDKQYSAALDNFFRVAFPKVPTDAGMRKLAKEYLEAKRRPKSDDGYFEADEAVQRFYNGVFPFRRKLWNFTARLAVEALYETSVSPKMPKAAATWPMDFQLALVIDLANSIRSILLHGQMEGLVDWREKVQIEKQRRLEKAGLWDRYQNRKNLEAEMFRAYGEYESLDRNSTIPTS